MQQQIVGRQIEYAPSLVITRIGKFRRVDLHLPQDVQLAARVQVKVYGCPTERIVHERGGTVECARYSGVTVLCISGRIIYPGDIRHLVELARSARVTVRIAIRLPSITDVAHARVVSDVAELADVARTRIAGRGASGRLRRGTGK